MTEQQARVQRSQDLHTSARGGVRDQGLESDVRQLKKRIRELEKALEKASHRISQILGERSELRRSLAEKDDRLEKVALGGFQQLVEQHRASPAERRFSFLHIWPFIGKIDKAPNPEIVDSLAESQSPKNPLKESSSNSSVVLNSEQSIFGGRHKHRILATLVVGLDGERLASVLDVVSARCSERQIEPLMITDSNEAWLFRKRELFFEYLPCRSEHRYRLDDSLDWDLYLKRRLSLIRRKWKPNWILSFGEDAVRLAALWNASPFEDSALTPFSHM